ncbi:MAG TPA: PP0621 family protein [Thiobacillaceae bacterium]|nr:PP0621 family protein [Thiobacillaceae bacterium]
MGKLLVLLILGFVIYAILKSYARSQTPDRRAPGPARGPEDMVKCARCGVNLPRSEALLSKGEFFCSREHQQLNQP